MSIDVLKLELSMPNAHFRIIHSNEPQKTYPVPPYSTVIGFLANILGNREQIEKMLEDSLALGVLSKFNYITHEYTWLRNLADSNHRSRFGSLHNRTWQEMPEHIGGQSPVSIEVLNDVHLMLYIYHPHLALLETVMENTNQPERWYSHLHLGRAEDWVVINSASIISLSVSNNPASLRNSKQYFQWMPEPASAFGINSLIDESLYNELYQKTQSPAMLVTSIYNLIKVPYDGKEGEVIRNFQHIPARLFSSSVPFLSNFTLPAVFVDAELKVPIYMANVVGGNSSGRGG